MVSCLKLIWRVVSAQPSPWVKWVQQTLIGKAWFWSLKDTTTKGSWMWRKIIKYKDLARSFHKTIIKNGSATSFWFDHWCQLGRLYETIGQRGPIDLGIPLSANMVEVLACQRWRNHRVAQLNDVEEAIQRVKRDRHVGDDISLWQFSEDSYKNRFLTSNTWNLMRSRQPINTWHKGVWFPHATPKYSFILWLAILNRLSTGDRMRSWNLGIRTYCIFCGLVEDSRNHLFFECHTSAAVWRNIVSKLLGSAFTIDWDLILDLHTSPRPKYILFLIRYAFQSTVYHIWRERNRRRNGEVATSTGVLAKQIAKYIQN